MRRPVRTLLLSLFLASALSAKEGPPSRRWKDPVQVGVTRLERSERRGTFLLELSLATAPSTATLSPRLEALGSSRPGTRYRYLELGSFESDRARRVGVKAVPAFFLYRDGRLVQQGTAAMHTFLAPPREPEAPPMLASIPMAPAVRGL